MKYSYLLFIAVFMAVVVLPAPEILAEEVHIEKMAFGNEKDSSHPTDSDPSKSVQRVAGAAAGLENIVRKENQPTTQLKKKPSEQCVCRVN